MPDPIDIGKELAELDIASELSTLEPQASHPQTAPTAAIGPDTRGTVQRALESFSDTGPAAGAIVGGLKRVDNLVRSTGDLARAGWNMVAPDSMDVDRPYLRQGAAPPVTPNEELGDKLAQVGEIYGGAKAGAQLLNAAPGMVARGLGISAKRAGQNFSEVAQAANQVPVNLERVRPAVDSANALAEAGAQRPKVVTKLVKRFQNPDAMNYEEGRRFYQNVSSLSAKDSAKANAAMHRQISEIKKVLNEALTESAESVGKGDQYTAAMREYRRAMQARKLGENAVKYGVPALGLGALGNYLIPSH